MILFYTPGTCALSELITLQWTDAPHRLCRVTREERQGPLYRAAVNPMGQVPALWIEGRVLTENTALLQLIADRYPEAGLVPHPFARERAELQRWLAWLDSTFHVAHKPLFAPQRFVTDPTLFDAVRAQAMTQIRQVLAHLDRSLCARDHLLLGRPTVLDAYAFALARWCESRIDYALEFPAVKRFLDGMRRDPKVARALAIETGPIDAAHVPFTELVSADGSLNAKRLT